MREGLLERTLRNDQEFSRQGVGRMSLGSREAGCEVRG